jgi:hypothetical protein
MKHGINTETPATHDCESCCDPQRIRPHRRDPIMTGQPQPHRTRGHRPGYQPTALADITICIHATPGVDAEAWRALHTDVDAAIDSSLKNTDSRVSVRRWPLNAEVCLGQVSTPYGPPPSC